MSATPLSQTFFTIKKGRYDSLVGRNKRKLQTARKRINIKKGPNAAHEKRKSDGNMTIGLLGANARDEAAAADADEESEQKSLGTARSHAPSGTI